MRKRRKTNGVRKVGKSMQVFPPLPPPDLNTRGLDLNTRGLDLNTVKVIIVGPDLTKFYFMNMT